MRIRGVVALAVACLLATCARSWAAPATAQEIPLVGSVRDSLGALVPTGDVAVRIYADSTGGAPVYDSGASFLGAIEDGVFDVLVGVAPVLLLDDEQDWFLELDAAGMQVYGPLNRWRFYPGGGSHARPDLEARLDSLESAMGLSAHPAPVASRQAAPVVIAANDSIHTVLGTGAFAGTVPAFSVSATMLLQPVGIRGAGNRVVCLGPECLPAPTAPVGTDDTAAPVRFAVRAQPNPFREHVGFDYSLPAQAVVQLTIYDVRGRCARRLVANAAEAPGTHRVTWDGRDQGGRRMPAGVYHYRLDTGTHRAAGRIVLLP
jgi:hypothetical protein